MVAIAVAAGALLVTAASAQAETTLRLVQSASATDSKTPKVASAVCHQDEMLLGGGGVVTGPGAASNRPVLTRLESVSVGDDIDGYFDVYEVTAAEVAPGTTSAWRVEAYAVCARGLPGVYTVSSPAVAPSSAPVQTATAVCRPGDRVIGMSAATSTVSGEVVLQVMRPSATGDILRVQAHEDADGYSHNWSVTARAQCAPPPPGYQVVTGASPQALSESVKLGLATCPPGTRLFGVGGATSASAPGNAALQWLVPAGRQAQALAVESVPTALDWDFIVATAICAL
jgi:hypothetical protein